MLEVEVHAQRTDGPSAAAGLLRVEPAEEHAGARLGRREGEAAGGRKLVVERFRWSKPRGVGSRRGGALDAAAYLTFGRAGEVRRAVAEVLLHHEAGLRRDSIVASFPAGVAIKMLRLKDCVRLVCGPGVWFASSQANKNHCQTEAQRDPRPRRQPVVLRACSETPVWSLAIRRQGLKTP